MKRFLISLFVFCMPLTALADENVSRRDGFLKIWDSVHREAKDVSEKDFQDVSVESDGYTKILYAKNRGILDDNTYFYPDEDLRLDVALLWLFRTRNVSNLQTMQLENLEMMLSWYPLLDIGKDLSAPIQDMDELTGYIEELDRLMTLTEHGVSYYADDFHQGGTAFGESFDMHAFTAAHRTLPHNTLVRVTNVENNKQVVVRINDRGPYVDGRDMDLSLASFLAISEKSRGVIQARFERLGDVNLVHPPLIEDDPIEPTAPSSSLVDEQENLIEQGEDVLAAMPCTMKSKRYQRRITRDVRFHRGVPHFVYQGEKISLGSTKFFVIRSLKYPNGSIEKMQQWIQPKKETYTISFDLLGNYEFYVSTGFGRGRIMRTHVLECDQ